jgi:hypothetical protein
MSFRFKKNQQPCVHDSDCDSLYSSIEIRHPGSIVLRVLYNVARPCLNHNLPIKSSPDDVEDTCLLKGGIRRIGTAGSSPSLLVDIFLGVPSCHAIICHVVMQLVVRDPDAGRFSSTTKISKLQIITNTQH